MVMIGVPYGIRTRVAAVKGRCPRPLDERDRGNEVLLTWQLGFGQGQFIQKLHLL
ncbi:unnamed protein product [Commensalibacter communis]|uniref:Uncharacterized protein n=1 Tax=Commensalibacter communis TaxID=2972786 RepID=A0A9W4X7A9_9PROT|nr:unnamed protein product [Commensalibacter communis]CAI3953406.1 unnamed protein product [Commensalibacter communis]CAI3953439.1 unnamed protein product [Commensalibacter communis]